MEPDEFYFCFENPPETSIKKRLITRIEELLTSKFYASSIKLTLKMLDTDLILRFNQLKSKPCEFEVYIGSIKDSEEIIRYTGSFSIEGVDKKRWDQFQARSDKCTIEVIKEELEKKLKDHFRQLSSKYLIYKTAEQASKIFEEVNIFAKQYIVEVFGLIITVPRFGRDDTKIESLKRETLQKLQATNLYKIEDQMKNQEELRAISFNISLNQIEKIKGELAEVQKHLQGNIITNPAYTEETLKYKQQEADLQKKLAECLHTNQEASEQIMSQQIASLSTSPDDDDFDIRPEKAKLESALTNDNDRLKSKSDHTLPNE